jgi:hypothetical protein
MSDLSSKLTAATIETAKWRGVCSRIQNQIAVAEAHIASSESRRAQYALDAAVDSTSAAAASIRKIHADDENTKRQLADLQLALIPASAACAKAEQAEAALSKALARETAQQTMRKRIRTAARIDAVLAELAREIQKYEDEGASIREFYGELYSGATNISTMENAVGLNRLLAALPAIFARLFPNALRPEQRSSLEKSERDFWSLPEDQPEPEPVKAKATAA